MVCLSGEVLVPGLLISEGVRDAGSGVFDVMVICVASRRRADLRLGGSSIGSTRSDIEGVIAVVGLGR